MNESISFIASLFHGSTPIRLERSVWGRGACHANQHQSFGKVTRKDLSSFRDTKPGQIKEQRIQIYLFVGLVPWRGGKTPAWRKLEPCFALQQRVKRPRLQGPWVSPDNSHPDHTLPPLPNQIPLRGSKQIGFFVWFVGCFVQTHNTSVVCCLLSPLYDVLYERGASTRWRNPPNVASLFAVVAKIRGMWRFTKTRHFRVTTLPVSTSGS